MKVLWVTNSIFAYHNVLLGQESRASSSGSWLTAAYDGLKRDKNIYLYIATASNVPKRLEGCDGRSYFYILPGGTLSNYDVNSNTNFSAWAKLRDDIQPDLIQIWGTESRFAYVAMKAFTDLRCMIYMQGVMTKIVEEYYSGVPAKFKVCTIKDLYNKFNRTSQLNHYVRQVKLEQEMIRMSTSVIVENDWCEDQCKSFSPDCIVFKSYLPIKQEFFNHNWNIFNIERHSIFTNAGGYPIKGHHILLKSLAIVKQKYPDVKLYIPGESYIRKGWGFRIRMTGYLKYLLRIINTNNLFKNIVFTGVISSEAMAQRIEVCHVYVMPSIVENHSSSLIEAMIVGAPCISSLVGGVASLIRHKHNGILYNSLDAESLAGNIIRIFENDSLALSISSESIKIREERNQDFAKDLLEIYEKV